MPVHPAGDKKKGQFRGVSPSGRGTQNQKANMQLEDCGVFAWISLNIHDYEIKVRRLWKYIPRGKASFA